MHACTHACIRQPNYSFEHGWMDCCMDAYIYIIHVYSCVHVHSRTHRSLTTLGRVVALLAEGQQNALPWRESKLTRLLQHSLGVTTCFLHVTVCYSVLQGVTGVLRACCGCVTVCFSMLHRVPVALHRVTGVLQRVTACYSMLQRVTGVLRACYTVLQACYSESRACHRVLQRVTV